MTGHDIGRRIQDLFDWCKDCLSAVENRWLVFVAAVMLFALLRALAASGLATFLALIYIMYFVTIALPDRDR